MQRGSAANEESQAGASRSFPGTHSGATWAQTQRQRGTQAPPRGPSCSQRCVEGVHPPSGVRAPRAHRAAPAGSHGGHRLLGVASDHVRDGQVQ